LCGRWVESESRCMMCVSADVDQEWKSVEGERVLD